ncbi:NADH:flavin oxidoreductase/NADH oxidase [Agromyces sp. NPDC058484]|uniref:NADH:flavin oxidoreductase/NADH oxidase n=1 Tax=Agromyces sp. NPDC058484 TaxID=3346524 RepID=UPI003667D6E2
MSSTAATTRASASVQGVFSSLRVGGLELPNRVGVSPMCMYASADGFATDFHLVHLGRFALGGAGLVIMEATAIDPRGRISHHDTGAWSDEHVPGLERVASFLAAHGAVPGIQLGHAGRRASVNEPWAGGVPLTDQDAAAGTPPWQTVAPSAVPAGPGWPVSHALTLDEIDRSIEQWRDAAARAVAAGFRWIELHGAHGYLLHSFLSPVSNRRDDAFGGDADRRMRYPLAVVQAIRNSIPANVALAYRMSAVDGIADGLTIDDTAAFATHLAAAGVDLIDTSSGGITTDRSVDTRVRRGFAFHADFSHRLREVVDIPVATVGFVVDPAQARLLIQHGDADLVLLGREMLDDPNWALHARRALDADEFAHWNVRYGSALQPRAKTLARLADSGETPLSRFT